jgi:hypothetical protein
LGLKTHVDEQHSCLKSGLMVDGIVSQQPLLAVLTSPESFSYFR